MKFEVTFTDLAHAEADLAFKWIEQSSPTNAVEWFNGLVDAIESLSTMPERCVVAPESEDVGEEIRQKTITLRQVPCSLFNSKANSLCAPYSPWQTTVSF